jgi:ankyrin repeat protein
MSEQIPGSAPAPQSLPDKPNLEWLRREAKSLLEELKRTDPTARLADAQFALAKRYGFSSWRALKSHVDAATLDGQLFDAARGGDMDRLAALLDQHPSKLHVRDKPYEWTLLHAAASKGQLAIVDELLKRGLDPNTREKGDNTYAMHWAAAAGHLAVVQRLADAGGDVVGQGDDHEGEVIGWATMWDGCDDDVHRAVVDFLIARGARHHIFSAVALNLADEVRRIVARDPSALNKRQSRNENHRPPLHFAIQKNRPEMAALLMELGADPLAVDDTGQSATFYATTPDVDRSVMERLRTMLSAELLSAARGSRPPNARPMDLVALLALHDWDTASRLLQADSSLIQSEGGALHMMANRNDVNAVKWLLERGADINGRWDSQGAKVTPLHLAAARGYLQLVRLLLDAGADPSAFSRATERRARQSER